MVSYEVCHGLEQACANVRQEIDWGIAGLDRWLRLQSDPDHSPNLRSVESPSISLSRS